MDEATPAELAEHLTGLVFPATRDELVAAARANGADDDMLARLQNIDEGTYDGLDAVSAAFSFEGGTTTRYGHVTVYDQ